MYAEECSSGEGCPCALIPPCEGGGQRARTPFARAWYTHARNALAPPLRIDIVEPGTHEVHHPWKAVAHFGVERLEQLDRPRRHAVGGPTSRLHQHAPPPPRLAA